MKQEKIGIVGSGLIGRAWCMLFTSVGYRVMLYDILPEQLQAALKEIESELHTLETDRKLRGGLDAATQFACVSVTTELKELVRNAIFIQECVPERLDIKRNLYEQLDIILEPETVISSSTSTLMPSLFSADLKHKENILVSHPLNPPYYIPLVEIVPAPWTSSKAIERTRTLMLEIGQRPVTLRREIEGFATNRIQYAILCEVWRLVADGILSVADADTVMAHGLGLRYALSGPLETAHLNANGILDYFARYGDEIRAVCETYGATPVMQEGPVLTEIAKQCEELLPAGSLASKRTEREKFLTELNELKKKL